MNSYVNKLHLSVLLIFVLIFYFAFSVINIDTVHATSYDVNIIQNGDATNDFDNWLTDKNTNNNFVICDDAGNNRFDFWPTNNTDVTSLYQIIDISDLSTDINTGNISLSFSGDMIKYNANLIVKYQIEELNNSNTIIGSPHEVELSNTGSWETKSINIANLNTETKKISVNMIVDANESFGAVYFDNTSLTLSLPADSTPPTLDSATRTNNNTLKITLDENCINLADSDAGGFTVHETDNNSIVYDVSSTEQGDNASEIVLNVEDIGASAKEGITIKYTASGSGDIEDNFSNSMITDSSGVSISAWDTVAPTATVTMTSSNANSSLAKTNDTITLSINADENITSPTVYIAETAATINNAGDSDESTWNATYTMLSTDNEGSIGFTVDFEDIGGNTATQITSVTSGTAVIFDKTIPSTTVTMTSSNANPELSKSNDTITLSINADEDISNIAVSIAGTSASINNAGDSDESTWNATYSMLPTDSEGSIDFTLDFTDLTGNSASQVTSVTSGTSVTFDKTAPTATVTMASSNSNSTLAKPNDTITLSINADEDISNIAVSIAGTSASINNAGDSDESTWNATYSMLPTDSEGSIGFTLDFTDLSGNSASQVISVTSGTAVTFDKTQPNVSIVTGASSYTNVSQFSITIGFSEDITGFDVNDLTISNGDVNNFSSTNSSTFTADITPSSQGTITMDVLNGVAQDNTGNVNTIASQLSRIYDSISPSIDNTGSEYNASSNILKIKIAETNFATALGNSAVDISKFTVKKGLQSHTLSVGQSTPVITDSATITITLGGTDLTVIEAFTGGEGIDSITVAEGGIIDAANNPNLLDQDNTVSTDIPPTIVSAVQTSNTTITVSLSETIKNHTNPHDGGFTVYDKEDNLISYTVQNTNAGVNNNEIVLMVSNFLASAKEGLVVTYTNNLNGEITDLTNNELETDSMGVSIDPWDTTAPSITTANLAPNNTFIDITVDEGIYGADNGTTPIDASDLNLSFTQNGGTATNVTISSVKQNNDDTEGTALGLVGGETIIRVFLDITGTTNGLEALEIKPTDSSSIYDKAGNTMVNSQTTGLKTLVDQTPPTLVNATRSDNNTIIVTLSKNCTSIDVDNDGGFIVTDSVTSSTYNVSAIDPSVDNSHVALTVADFGLSGKEGLKVTYSTVGNGAIQDLVGNDLATDTTGVSIAPWDTTSPTISSALIAPNNTFIDITVDEGIYGADNATSPIDASDLNLSFYQNSGTATDVTLSSVKQNDDDIEASASALLGGETTIRVFLNITGTPNGIESIEIESQNANCIYDKAGNAMSDLQTTGEYNLDSMNPIAGNSGVIIVDEISKSSIKISWDIASDNMTVSSNLLYRVFYSKNNNIDNITDALANELTPMSWITDENQYTIPSLTHNTTYYINIFVKDIAGNITAYTTKQTKTTKTPSSKPSTSTSNTTTEDIENEDDNSIVVVVNGKQQEPAGETTDTTIGEQKQTTITLDEEKIDTILETIQTSTTDGEEQSSISIPVSGDSDIVISELNGQMVNEMEKKQVVLEIKTDQAEYSIPAQEIDINQISNTLGKNITLSDIKVEIEISKPNNDKVKFIEDKVSEGGYTIVAPAVEFNVKCTHNDTTIKVNKFESYVKRTIQIPQNVDANKITTGIIVDEDGSIRHVPTKIVIIDGKYYAQMNSLTNSTYSVIWNEKHFSDIDEHWAKNAINDMGSRLIIEGKGDNMFAPNEDITRAEFSAILVHALGLKPESKKITFVDVEESDWYYKYIETAHEYNIINGYENGEFKPNDKVTREEAITMIERAMKITKLEVNISENDIETILNSFDDGLSTGSWAKNSIATCVKGDIIKGRDNNLLAPKDCISRAEVAVIIRRLLQKSNLI